MPLWTISRAADIYACHSYDFFNSGQSLEGDIEEGDVGSRTLDPVHNGGPSLVESTFS